MCLLQAKEKSSVDQTEEKKKKKKKTKKEKEPKTAEESAPPQADASGLLTNDEGEKYVQLSGKRRMTVRSYKGMHSACRCLKRLALVDWLYGRNSDD